MISVGQVWSPQVGIASRLPLVVVALEEEHRFAVCVHGTRAGDPCRDERIEGRALETYFRLEIEQSLPDACEHTARAWALLLDVRVDARIGVIEGCDGLEGDQVILAAARYLRWLDHCRELAEFEALDRVATDVTRHGFKPADVVGYCGPCLDVIEHPQPSHRTELTRSGEVEVHRRLRQAPKIEHEAASEPGRDSLGLGRCSVCGQVAPLFNVPPPNED